MQNVQPSVLPILKKYIYFFLAVCVSVAMCRLFSSRGEQGPHSVCGGKVSHCFGFFGCREQSLESLGFSSGSTWAQLWFLSSKAQAQQLWCMGFIARQYVGYS